MSRYISQNKIRIFKQAIVSRRLFHPSTESKLNAEVRGFNPNCPPEEVSEKAVFAINQKLGSTSVFLSSVKCFVKDSYCRKWKIRGLLDIGSMTNLITIKFVEKLGLRKEKVNILVTCLNDSSVCVENCVTTEISNSDGSYKKRIKMLVVDKITDIIPIKNLNVKGLIPENINLADDSFYVQGPIDCLLDAEIFMNYCVVGKFVLKIPIFFPKYCVWVRGFREQ
ncbi:DUF1758 domain-containing protein [Trichonephila clavipes]|nr:DUF1758 domain-containing protein [Trichonephila clavipes]